MSIVAVGSVAFDSIETPCGKVENALGGSVSHFSFSASLFCNDISIVGIVGKDFKKEYIEMFLSKNINIDNLKVEEGKTFKWEGKYENNMNEAITLNTELNLFQNFSPHLNEITRKKDIVFLANIDPELQLNVLNQVKNSSDKKIITACDTMNFWISSKPEKVKEVFKNVDIIFINDKEAQMISARENIIEAGRSLLEFANLAVILKRGSAGAILFYKENLYIAPSFPVTKVIDPTGAGDSFAGGFMGYISSQFDQQIKFETLKTAVLYANVMGSFNVEDFGTNRIFKLQKEEFQKRYNLYLNAVKF